MAEGEKLSSDSERIEKYVETMLESVVGEVAFGFSTAEEEPLLAQDLTSPVEEVEHEKLETMEAEKVETSSPEVYDSATQVFEERQRQFLIGRRVSRDILDDEGNILVREGTLVDEQVMDRVRAYGKMVDLIMNNIK